MTLAVRGVVGNLRTASDSRQRATDGSEQSVEWNEREIGSEKEVGERVRFRGNEEERRRRVRVIYEFEERRKKGM